MKKLFFFLLVALMLGSQGSLFAGDPVRPYNENGYSIAEVKAFAVGSSELSRNWRREFLGIINNALVASGEDLNVGQNHLYWILDRIQYERRKIQNFSNSKRVGDKIEFFTESEFNGVVAVFRYRRCEVVVFKTICLNLLKVSGGYVSSLISQEDPVVTSSQSSAKVYMVDTIHKKVYVYDTIFNTTTVYEDRYYYGDGSSYAYYAYAQPVWYSYWLVWPVYRYENFYSFREYNCCCNFYTDYYHQEINYDYRTYYGSRTELPSGRGYDPLPENNRGQGYDPSPPNGRELPRGGDPGIGYGRDPGFKNAKTTVQKTIGIQKSSRGSAVRTTESQRSFSQPSQRYSNGGGNGRQSYSPTRTLTPSPSGAGIQISSGRNSNLGGPAFRSSGGARRK